MKSVLCAMVLIMAFAGAAAAENVAYILPAEGITSEETGAKAVATFDKMDGILKVQALVEKHEIVVAFDNGKLTLEKVKEALAAGGFQTGEAKPHKLLPAPQWLP